MKCREFVVKVLKVVRIYWKLHQGMTLLETTHGMTLLGNVLWYDFIVTYNYLPF